MHIVYFDADELHYRAFETTWSSPSILADDPPYVTDIGLSSSSNDLYLAWNPTPTNYIKFRQYDAAPLAPQNLNLEPDANRRPYLTWDENQEPDVISGGYYNVWKKKFYDFEWHWDFLAQTTNNYYLDTDETMCPGPQHCANEMNIYYRVTAVDKELNESVPSDEVVAKIIYDVPYKTNLMNPNSLNVKEYSLSQNYPNPFNPITTIAYSIKHDGLVSLKVYDVLGNEVASLVNDNQAAGNYSVQFDASDLPSGIYFYKLISGNFISVKKLILMK